MDLGCEVREGSLARGLACNPLNVHVFYFALYPCRLSHYNSVFVAREVPSAVQIFATTQYDIILMHYVEICGVSATVSGAV